MRAAVVFPLAAAIAFVAGAWRMLDEGGRRSSQGFPPGSVFNQTPEGASSALRYLAARRSATTPPQVLTHRLGPGALPKDAVLFRLRPMRAPFATASEESGNRAGARRHGTPPRPLLAPAEEAWVRAGGRLVLAIDASYGPLEALPASLHATVRKTFPLWPGLVSLVPGPSLRALGGSPVREAQTLFASGSQPLLSRLELSRGEVILLSAPEILENGGLGRADHLRLLEALAAADRPVAFDEWAHGLGQEPGLVVTLLGWGLGPALLVASVACALALWRGRARLGPPEADPLEARSEAVDLVDSLAQLYDRALSRREAAALHEESFRRSVATRTALRGSALERRACELLGGPLPALPTRGEITSQDLAQRLSLVNAGYRRLHEHAHPR